VGRKAGKERQGELGFEGLRFYQLALELLKAAYQLADKLPKYEQYNLADQLRRAAVSVTLNIAEGYGRYHYLDRIRFFYIARSSLNETLSAFISARAVGYADEELLSWVRSTATEAEMALNGYIGFIYKQKRGHEAFGNKYIREDTVEYTVLGTRDKGQGPSP
jgi:four helix bundle protein